MKTFLKKIGGEKEKKMNTKQYLILVLVLLAFSGITFTSVSAATYGPSACPCVTASTDTIHGDIYYDHYPGTFSTSGVESTTFTDVPAGIKFARVYTGVWGGSPGCYGSFQITVNGDASPIYDACDPEAPEELRCNVVDEPECHLYVTGCCVNHIWYNATPYIVPGDNTVKMQTFGNGWDGRIYFISLLVVYENESMSEITYWINEGAVYMDIGSGCSPNADEAFIYFNGTIDPSNINNVEYWTYGEPNNLAVNPELNGNNIGNPDSDPEWRVKWNHIPPGYLDTSSNLFYYYDPAGSYNRAQLAVLILEHGGGGPNQPPVADPDGPYTGTEGTPLTFDGSGSYDSDGSIVSYEWDFGDGNTGTGVSPTHTYALEGTYTVTLTVTDNDAATDTKTTTASIADADPIADFSGSPTYGPSPLTVTFTDASTSYDGITTWEWDFDNNGVIDSTVQNPTYVYEVDGVYSVKLTVHEADGDIDSETRVDYITVTAANIPPVADAGSDQNAAFGATVTFNGSGSYDTDGSIVSYDWDFGDGSTGTGEITTHAYSTEGTYTVTLTVTDNDSATGNDTAVVTVNPPGGYTGNHPLTIYEHDTINGGLVYKTVTDGSKYKCLWPVPSTSEETRPVLYHDLKIDLPENATVKTARLYNTYCWSCWGGDDYAPGPPAQARLNLTSPEGETWSVTLTHEYTPETRDSCPNPIVYGDDNVVHYWDTKGPGYAPPGETMWDFPSGEFAWNVTGLVTHSGTYNASIVDPRDRLQVGDERFCTFGFGLLVVYEDPSSAKIKYEIAEGCDILMARTYETPENATTSATFGGVSNAVNANLTTVVTSSDGGTFDPPENMIYFNDIEIGPSTAGGIYHYGVSYFDVTSNLNTDQNVIEFQDRDDCEYVHNAFLVVELPDDVATADIPVEGTVTGTYMDTHVSDNVYEVIEEVESKGKPTNRYSYLEHKWTIDVTSGSDATFYVEAYHTANSEGDDFVFEYSMDDSTYTPMVTVTKTTDGNTYLTYTFTELISGTVYVRVRDTDQTAGNRTLDTIYIDHMFIRSVSGPPGYGVTVTIDEASQQVKPGENTTYTVSVKNTGDLEASYSVVMSGTAVDEGTITVSPLNGNTGILAPNAEDVQTVTVSTTTSTPDTTYTLTARATCEQDGSVKDSATSELVVSSAENTMHVASIDMSLSDRTAGKNTFTHANAVVTIVDVTGIAVEGATVYGTWSNATSDTDSGVTDANGQVALDSDEVKNAKSGTTFTFTVDNVELTGWTYDPSANNETSDSKSVP